MAVRTGKISDKVTLERWQATEQELFSKVEGIKTANGVDVHVSAHLTERTLGNPQVKREPVAVDDIVQTLQDPKKITKQANGRLRLESDNAFVAIDTKTGKITTVIPRKKQ